MPICRICGCEFKGKGSRYGVEICGNDNCWKKAWSNAVNPFSLREGNKGAKNTHKSRRIPDEVKRRVIELHKEGKKRKEIADITGYEYNTVSYIIRSKM